MNFLELRNIELYYSPLHSEGIDKIRVEGEECKHILKVMRHNIGDEIYITNGAGSIFKTKINRTEKDIIETQIVDGYNFENKLRNIYFCIPKLRIPDRLESALEKCTELGITNFIIFETERTVSRGDKTDRWKKILISAMKQSLRSYLPVLSVVKSLKDIKSMNGKKILFSQDAEKIFIKGYLAFDSNYYLIFGPEGDFASDEINLFAGDKSYNLGEFRLRSETAIIKCASLL